MSLLSLSPQFRKSDPASDKPLQVEWQKRVRALESLLKAEQARCRTQSEELVTLRGEVSRVKELQTDLAVERESGKLIVQWLQEAEQQITDIHQRLVMQAVELSR